MESSLGNVLCADDLSRSSCDLKSFFCLYDECFFRNSNRILKFITKYKATTCSNIRVLKLNTVRQKDKIIICVSDLNGDFFILFWRSFPLAFLIRKLPSAPAKWVYRSESEEGNAPQKLEQTHTKLHNFIMLKCSLRCFQIKLLWVGHLMFAIVQVLFAFWTMWCNSYKE